MRDPMGESAIEVGYCVDMERPRVIRRRIVTPPPSQEEWLASQPTADEADAEPIADAARAEEEWERELAALLRTKP